jgi:hypothetical protein
MWAEVQLKNPQHWELVSTEQCVESLSGLRMVNIGGDTYVGDMNVKIINSRESEGRIELRSVRSGR